MNNSIQRVLTIFFSLIALTIVVSCSKDDPINDKSDNSSSPNDKIEYYVKYESEVYIPISRFIPIDIVVETEEGTKNLSVPRTWEGVFGPFNKLTTLIIASKTTGYNTNMTHCRGRISICKNNQPYILKVDESFSGTSYFVSYKVTADDLK